MDAPPVGRFFAWFSPSHREKAYTRSVPKRLLFVSNPVATWLPGWQDQKLMVCRLAKWLNTINKWTKWSILLSAKFEFYTLLSAKYLYSSVFPPTFGYEYCDTFILYLFALSFRSPKKISLVSFRARAQRDSKFFQETTLKKMFRVHARWNNFV